MYVLGGGVVLSPGEFHVRGHHPFWKDIIVWDGSESTCELLKTDVHFGMIQPAEVGNVIVDHCKGMSKYSLAAEHHFR